MHYTQALGPRPRAAVTFPSFFPIPTLVIESVRQAPTQPGSAVYAWIRSLASGVDGVGKNILWHRE